MTSDELSALRAMLREEINAAVYASEQRLREEINATAYASEQRLREEINAAVYASEQRLGERIDELKTTVGSMNERLARVEFVQKQMTVNLVQVASVLDEATIKINDLQRSQVALETKVEENTASLKRDLQKLNYSVRGFMDNMIDAVAGITMRLDMHKDTPLNDAHPNSAA
jgi:chromosome segregation ATPase